jgi:hypothetical protein
MERSMIRNPARRQPLTLAFALMLAVATAACSVAGNGAGTPASPDAITSPAASTLTATAAPHSTSDAWLVVGERGDPALQVVLASTREQLIELPTGVPGERWGQVVTTTTTDGATRVEELVVQPDLPAWRSRVVDGSWRLPTIGYDALPVGVSADGGTIVLVEDGVDVDPASTRFAVLANGDPARVIELPGALDFDALSPDGSILYVIEHLPAPPEARYQVRAVDVATGLMREPVIVDKRNIDASMGGWPITQERHENGIVFTLYRAADHPFIHALNSKEAWAVCLGLPLVGHVDAEASLDWGMAQSPGGDVCSP